MSTPLDLTDAERARLRREIRRLVAEAGPDVVAGILGVKSVVVFKIDVGQGEVTLEHATRLARFQGVPLDAWLDRKTAPATVPKPEDAAPSVVAPTAPTTQTPEPPPLPAAPSMPGEQTGIMMAIASGSAALSLLEYASLSMGLELLPHRRDDVFEQFGLRTEQARTHEVEAWARYFDEHPRERRDWEPMRQRMRERWLRFDDPRRDAAPAFAVAPVSRASTEPPPRDSVPWASGVATPAASFRELGAAPPPAASGAFDPSANGAFTELYQPRIELPDEHAGARPNLPALTLEAYANLCAELQHAPQRAEETFARYGLAEPSRRASVDAAWKARLRDNPGDRWEWERRSLVRRNELTASDANREPEPPPSPPTQASMGRAATPPMSLALYALMCVELEKKPQEARAILERHGVVDPAKRLAVENYWRARLRQHPSEQAEFSEIAARIRSTWIDL